MNAAAIYHQTDFMGFNEDDITLRLALDASQAKASSKRMLEDQDEIGRIWVTNWKKKENERVMMSAEASAKIDETSRLADVEQAARNNRAAALWRAREASRAAATAAAETEMLNASWARYQANLEKKAAADKLFFEQQAARYAEADAVAAVGAGSVPANMAGGAAVGAAGAAGAAINSRETRETLRIMRELSRGNLAGAFSGLTVFLAKASVAVRGFIRSLLGITGLILGAALAGAYVLYEDIKNFNKSMDQMAKENEESIGNVAKAIKETTDKGIAAAVEFDSMIKHLGDSHITLAEAVKMAVKAINEEATALEKLLTARGRLEIAAISMAESSGQITHAQANAARAASSGDTLYAVESAKFKALTDEGKTLAAAQKAATQNKVTLEMAGRTALFAVSGVDERGNVINRAAFNRNKRIREAENLQEQIKKQQELVDAADKSGGSDIGNWVSGALDPLANHTLLNPLNWGTNPKGAQVTKDDLTQGEKDIIEKERALLKKKEDQNKNDIAAQKAAEEAYKLAVDAIKENAASLKSVNDQLAEFGTKYKDSATAMGVLKTTIQANIDSAQAAINYEFYNAERVTPTIEMIAGRKYMGGLNRLYGEGGRFDLEAGNGYLSGAAQDYELAQKQQMWALEYERKQYDPATRMLVPGSDADNARVRAVADKNMLGAAGLETPEMKMDDMVANGKSLIAQMEALNKLIASGVPISDEPTVPSTAPAEK